MGGGGKVLKLVQQPHVLFSLPLQLQKGIFDLLFVVLRRGTYDVVKFQYDAAEDVAAGGDGAEADENEVKPSKSMTSILLDLLRRAPDGVGSTATATSSSTSSASSRGGGGVPVPEVSERIIRLLGLTFSAGCTSDELKEVLCMLREPTLLTVPLLKTMKSIIKHDSGMAKASPPSFFSFGGHMAGLYSVFGPFPFSREYQIFTWFRVDKFESSSAPPSGAGSSSSSSASRAAEGDDAAHPGHRRASPRQHIVSIVDSSMHGVDIYLEHNVLTVSVSDAKHPASVVAFDAKDLRLTRGVWYHLAVRHVKPRISLFSKVPSCKPTLTLRN